MYQPPHFREDRLDVQHDLAPEPFVAVQIKGIVGLEIVLRRVEGRWKVSQNWPEQDRLGVRDGLRAQGHETEPMAALVAAYGRLAEDETH